MENLIETNLLSKTYRKTKSPALDRLSIAVKSGEVYGFLGANGAGKSTAIRTLLNFIQPTGGSATIMGKDIVKDSVEIKRHVGYLAGEIALYNKMTGQQFLNYMAALQPPKNKAFRAKLVKHFDADLRKPIDTLSKGNRQKIGLIQAFQHEPDVIILDEPTSGLDPLMQEQFYRLIRVSKDRGAAVFVSSHNFAEVERMCDRVGFIREGRLVAEQSLAELNRQAGHSFTITFADAVPLSELRAIKGIKLSGQADNHVKVSLSGELTPLLRVLAQHHVVRLIQHEVNLEDEFLKFYGKKS